MTALAEMQPLQIQCAAPSCRRRQTVRLTDMYHVEVRNKSGGSHRDAGWKCGACKQENVTSASLLRKGVLALLPSREALESSRAPVPVAAPDAPGPRWANGPQASAMLKTALARIAASGGDAVGLSMEDGVQQTVEMPSDLEGVLSALESANCHLLVATGPNADGSTWQLVLHPSAGAATLVSAQ